MKKVLVTGCSGYIGSHLCKMLKDQEYIVHGLDLVEPKVPVHDFFKLDINKLFNLDSDYDCVIHLAALVRVNESEQHPIMYYTTNLNGTMNVLEKVETKNFIFSSTGVAEYCSNPYGISKRVAEDVIKEYCTKHNPTKFTIFRFYNVVGNTVVSPTNPDGLMYNLLKAVDSGRFTINGDDYDTNDGTCVRDYVHVEEICESMIKAIDNPSNDIECLGHGIGFTVNEIVEVFKAVNNVNFEVVYGPRRAGDLPYSVLENPSKFMEPKYRIDQLLSIGQE